jgi:hypothetical protein
MRRPRDLPPATAPVVIPPDPEIEALRQRNLQASHGSLQRAPRATHRNPRGLRLPPLLRERQAII